MGVVVSKNNKDKSSSGTTASSKSGSGSSSTSGSSSNSTLASGDPSVFVKDARLRKSFYGLAYTPEGSLPDHGCSSKLGNYCYLSSLLPSCKLTFHQRMSSKIFKYALITHLVEEPLLNAHRS